MNSAESIQTHHDIGSRVLADQAKSLQGNLVKTMLGSAVMACVVGWLFRHNVPSTALVGWVVFLLIHCALNLGAGWQMAQRPTTPRNAARRLKLAAYAYLINGLFWGVGVLLLWDPNKFELQFLLIFVMTGMTSAALHSLHAHLPAFYGFFLPSLASVLLGVLWHGSIYGTALFIGVGCHGLVHWHYANLLHRTLVASLRRRYELVQLASDLHAEKDRAEKANLAKSRFLAAASHDLRQPVHALSLFVGALGQQPLEQEGRRLLEYVRTSVDTMGSMFNSLLDVSKLDAGMVQPELCVFPVKPMLERICTDEGALAHVKGLTLQANVQALSALTDPTLLERIIRNLIANAVNYTDKGGVLVTVRPRGQQLAIRVIDSGVGIPAERREEVFKEFVQLNNTERDRAKGLGLGLAIVRRLVDLLALPLILRSRPGRGTVFTLLVPMAISPSLTSGVEAVVPMHAYVQTRSFVPNVIGDIGLVLVIDDDDEIRVGMRALLAGWGFDVVGAAGLDDLMPVLARLPDVPELIISDYRLRGSETGLMVVEHLRNEYNQDIPGILITGDTAPERLREALSAGLILLHKPVSPKDLFDAMNIDNWPHRDRRLMSR